MRILSIKFARWKSHSSLKAAELLKVLTQEGFTQVTIMPTCGAVSSLLLWPPMAFTMQQAMVVRDALNQRVTQPCPMCRSRNWSVMDELVMFQLPGQTVPLSSLLGQYQFDPVPLPPPFRSTGGSRVLPCVATVCNVCGATQFHNVGILGIAQYFTEEAQHYAR